MIIIDINNNLVTFDDSEVSEADSSSLAFDGSVGAVKDGNDYWIEKTPFNGREEVDSAAVDAIIEEAQNNLPKTVFDVNTGEPLETKQGDPTPTGYSDTLTTEAKDYQRRLNAVSEIESQRKLEEDKGVTINNIRYSGGEKNRTALQEAINYLKDSNGTTFPVWKDSDDQYHTNHPLKDVEDALRAIGVRRMKLISKESEHVKSAIDGTIINIDNLDWTV